MMDVRECLDEGGGGLGWGLAVGRVKRGCCQSVLSRRALKSWV